MNCTEPTALGLALLAIFLGVLIGMLFGYFAWHPAALDRLDDEEYIDTYQGRYPQGLHQACHHNNPTEPRGNNHA